jgi:hypothetical protein
MDREDDSSGEIPWPDVDEHNIFAKREGVRAADMDKEEKKKAFTKETGRCKRTLGMHEEHDTSSLPPIGRYACAVAVSGIDAETTAGDDASMNWRQAKFLKFRSTGTDSYPVSCDLEAGDGGTSQSTRNNSGALSKSTSSAPYGTRVGAIAVVGIHDETAEPGDDGSIVIGDESVAITERTEPVVAEAVTRDMWTDEVREQLRSEIQEETQAQFRSQIAAAELVVVEGSSELQPKEPPFWTPRKRVGIAAPIALAVIVAIVVGVLFATGILGGGDGEGEPRPIRRSKGRTTTIVLANLSFFRETAQQWLSVPPMEIMFKSFDGAHPNGNRLAKL